MIPQKTALITGITGQDGSYLGMQIRWEGEGVNEVGYWLNPPLPLSGEGRDGGLPSAVPVVRIDPRYFRPTEVETLLGDPIRVNTMLAVQAHYHDGHIQIPTEGLPPANSWTAAASSRSVGRPK